MRRFHSINRQARSSNRFRPTLEGLEERWNPAKFIVTSDADDGAGSLRAAVALAKASPDKFSSITFAPSLYTINNQEVYTDIYLQSQITIQSNLTITGAGAWIDIHGSQGSSNPVVAGWRVFSIAQGTTVRIVDLNMSDGGANAAGDPNGGIINVNAGALLTLSNDSITNGVANGDGGGIWVGQGGTLEVRGGRVAGNTASGNGGGIAVTNGANVTIRDGASVTQNTATGDGGGAWLTGTGNPTNPPVVTINSANFDYNTSVGTDAGV